MVCADFYHGEQILNAMTGESSTSEASTNPTISSPGGRKSGGLLAYGWIEDPNSAFTDEGLIVPSGLDLVPLIARTAGTTSSRFR